MKRSPETYVQPDLVKVGVGAVIVVRYKRADLVEAGMFLVDMFCRGILSGEFFQMNETIFRDQLLPEYFEDEIPEPKPGSYGRKLVEDAMAYARNLGLSPGSGYKAAARVFGGIDPKECKEEFQFGKNGKPLYIQSPHDTTETVERILSVLRARCGEGEFDYILGADDEEDDFPAGPFELLVLSSDPGDEPSSEALEFAEEYRSEHAEAGEVIFIPGGSDSPASEFLTRAIDFLRNNEEKITREFLNATVAMFATLWNIAVLPEELREKAIAELPEELREKLAHRDLPTMDSGLIFLKWRILGEDGEDGQLENPRLLLIAAEPPEDPDDLLNPPE